MNIIVNPVNGQRYKLYSKQGKQLLKQLINNYNTIKKGGMDPSSSLSNLQSPPLPSPQSLDTLEQELEKINTLLNEAMRKKERTLIRKLHTNRDEVLRKINSLRAEDRAQSEALDTTNQCFDYTNRDYQDIISYLQENEENFVVYHNGKYTCQNLTNLKIQYKITRYGRVKDHYIWYKCYEANNSLDPTNVDKSEQFVKFPPYALFVKKPLWYPNNQIPFGSRIYHLEENGDKIPGLVSNDILDYLDTEHDPNQFLGSDHCNQKTYIQTYNLIDFVDRYNGDIILISQDNEFPHSKEIAKMSILILKKLFTTMHNPDFENLDGKQIRIFLPNINSEILTTILTFCKRVMEEPMSKIQMPIFKHSNKTLTKLDNHWKNLIKIEQLVKLLSTAIVMMIPHLINVTSSLIALQFKKHASTDSPEIISLLITQLAEHVDTIPFVLKAYFYESKLPNLKTVINNSNKEELQNKIKKIFTNLPRWQPQNKDELQTAVIEWSDGNQDEHGDINTWDTSKIKDMSGLFAEDKKFNDNISAWNVSNVTNMREMFFEAHAFNQHLNSWDVSKVTNMNSMFKNAKAFNQPLNNWDVSSVTNMVFMFTFAQAFNQPLNTHEVQNDDGTLYMAWDVSKVTNMSYMFMNARVFNQSLDSWNVSNVTNMEGMFTSTRAFNQSLNNWNVSNVTNMRDLFANAKAFNQPLNNWNVSKVTNMQELFNTAEKFNQPLDKWNVDNITNMSGMFANTLAFNQPLNIWKVSKVTNMSYMFMNARVFNQSLDSWNVSNVTNMEGMFTSTRAFNQSLNNWNVSNVTNMSFMFASALAFNQPLNSWNVSNVTDMGRMFRNARVFNQPLDSWNMSSVTNMRGMFHNAQAFNQHLDSWNVSLVTTNTKDMFSKSDMANNLPTWFHEPENPPTE